MINEFRGKYFFLSNFYKEDPTFTNEHRFQSLKTENVNERVRVLMAETAKEAKQLGRKVSLRPDWEDVKDSIMELTLRIKFEDPELRQKLLDTGNEELIEGNNWGDKYWGQVNGVGENKLGKILMKLRAEYAASWYNEEDAGVHRGYGG